MDSALAHASELLSETPLIDGHNDLAWTIRNSGPAPDNVAAYNLRQKTPHDTDLPRLRQGKIAAQFWSVFLPYDEPDASYVKRQLGQIDLVLRMVQHYSEHLQLALTAHDILKSFHQGKIASLIGLEGGHVIENSLAVLRMYYRLGARYMSLTHNVTTDWADSATDAARHGGLSPFGCDVVREMNRLGMLVDLSHVSTETMHDALDTSAVPVIFSHSSARALVDHPRNVPDEVLHRLPENGGIVMITFIPYFVSQDRRLWEAALEELKSDLSRAENWQQIKQQFIKIHGPVPVATVADVADHIEYIRKVAGIEHIGIGSDYWASGDMPEDLEDVSCFPNLFAELIRRGWHDNDLKKLAGENFLRVLRAAEEGRA